MKQRRMEESDLEAVNRVLSESQAEPHIAGPQAFPPLRSMDLLRMARAACPEAALVVEEKGRVGGFLFARIWGRTGWIGPMGVEAALQGQGLGTCLMEEAVEALKRAGATVIGAEVPPAAPRGIGFLSGMGFRPLTPTLEMERHVEEEGLTGEGLEPVYYSSLLEDDRSVFLEDVRLLSSSLDSDLDYSREVELVEEHGMGDSFLLRREAENIGLAICHTRPHAQEGDPDLLRVSVLALDEAYPFPSLEPLLGVVGLLAKEARASRVLLPVPSRCWEALRSLLALGYHVGPARIRMTLLGYPERGEAGRVNLARWA